MQGLEAKVKSYLGEARGRRSALLWTPGSNPVTAGVEALADYVSDLQGRPSLAQPATLVEKAAELLLREEPQLTEDNLVEAFEEVAQRIRERVDQEKFSIKTRNELGLLFVLEVTHRRAQAGDLSPSSCAALTLAANTLDDTIARSIGGIIYALRPLILLTLSELSRCIQTEVRHMDLLIRFKHVARALLEKRWMRPGDDIAQMRELLQDIEERIQTTHDGVGPGPCSDGSPVKGQGQSGRTFRLGRLQVTEAALGLPQLKAQLLAMLGHLLVKSWRGSHTAAFEEAFDFFDQARGAYRELSQWEAAAQAAVRATECLDRLAQQAASSWERDQAIVRLLDYGAAHQAWVLESPLPETQRLRFAKLFKAVLGRAESQAAFWGLDKPPASSEDEAQAKSRLVPIIERLFQEASVFLELMHREDAQDSWLALNLGWTAWIRLQVLLSSVHGLLIQYLEPQAVRRSMDKWREKVRTLLREDVIDSFLSALEGARSEWWSAERQFEADPAMSAGDYLLLSPFRLQEVLLSFLELMAESRQQFTAAQLMRLQQALDPLKPEGLPTRTLLKLVVAEPTVLGWAAHRNVSLDSACEYFEQRLQMLNQELANPHFSASERLLLSSWISNLLLNLRMSTDDFARLEPSRALALLDVSGAWAFRAESLLYGRGESGTYAEYTNYLAEDMVGALEREDTRADREDGVSNEALFSNLHDARHELDIWGRLTMIIEASEESPEVREAFAPRLTEAGHRTWVFPPSYSFDQIALRTGARPEDCHRTETATVVRMEMLRELPRNREHLERARHWLLQAVDLLLQKGLIPHGKPAPLATAESMTDWLAAHPRCAIVVPGCFPEFAMPLSVFFYAGGSVIRYPLGTQEEIQERAAAFPAFMELTQALGHDQREVSKASWTELGGALQKFSEVFAKWSQELADLLERHGLREVLFLLRGREYVYIPWEELRTTAGGPRLGERFTVGYLHTLAPLPEPVSGDVARQGVLQLHGDGVSLNQMKMARFIQESLAAEGAGRPPLSGLEARDAHRLQRELRSASRLRLFLHGHHDQLNPESDRITLVDAERPEERVNIQSEVVRSLPLAGVECVELWACEGSAHGRSIGEHGASEEPEDLARCFLLAGARRVLASLWHVPALPSALLMERFALLVNQGLGEAHALAQARSECRTAFEPGGLVEREMEARVAPVLSALAAKATSLDDEQLTRVLEPALDSALQLLRQGWRMRQQRAQQSIPELSHAMGRLMKYSAPRPERTAAELRTDPAAVGRLVRDWLSAFRNPMCWAGWRLVIRRLEDWHP